MSLAGEISLRDIPKILHKLPVHEQEVLLAELEKLQELKDRQLAQDRFIPFVQAMWPSFIAGRHHYRMAEAFERVARGELKRLIINMPPRHTKSEFASYLLPAWFLGKFPDKKIIQCSHTAELAVGFGRKVRNLVDDEDYHRLFPAVSLASDSKAAGRWNTSKKGIYFAIGVGGAVTGMGADLLIIDDPHALEITTPIPTPDGFIALGDLKVGDYVYGPDGEPTRVVAKSPVYEDRELYEVETYDGEIIYADAKHLWNVRTSTRIKDPYRNLTTEELVEARSSAFMIPRHSAVQYPVRDLPIDPWVLGAWLGDGTSSLGRMTAHPDDALFMRAEFKRRGYETTDLADRFNFGVTGLWTQLKALGVLDSKHIPEQYMTASFLQRMDLLCGLMDTDGNVTAQGQCAFHNKDERLVDQVVELLRSLGRKCRKRTYATKGKYGACTMHRVTFKLKDCALMPRKRMRTKTTHDKQHRSITVRKTDQRGAVQCITVDREDGLFLAGRGYVVTHNSEQEAALAEANPDIYDKTYEWYTSGPRQRLQPGGAIVIVATRWAKRDLCGQILKDAAANDSLDEWEVIEFPAILPSGNPLWPEFWELEELLKVKRDVPNSKWQAQYQQNPVSESAAIVKREWWQTWESDVPPKCEFILQSWDTAFEKTQRADYSACTTWGVFYRPDATGAEQANIILLNAFRDRMEFPLLKQTAIEEYREWEPDSVIIEKKASGAPLIYEMRAMGIPVSEFTPTRGNDKISRLNAVADIFASGRVWAPATRWAEEVIDEVAEFPASLNDDYCLVAGTRITMGDGTYRRIEDIKTGDFVATPQGPCRVSAAGITGIKLPLDIYLSTGATLGITENHPVFSGGKWVTAGHLKPNMAVDTESTRKDSVWQGLKLSSLTGGGTAGILKRPTPRIARILGGRARASTGMYGSFTTGLYLTDTISTMLTGILQTTVSRILNAYPQVTTGSSIGQKSAVSAVMSNVRILNSYAPSLPSGMHRRKGGSGTDSMHSPRSGLLKRWKRGTLGRLIAPSIPAPAGFAEPHSRPRLSAQWFAAAGAGMLEETAPRAPGGRLPLSNSLARAWSAVLSLFQFKPGKSIAPAPVRIVRVCERSKPEPVYNLTVEGAHCYYAEGVLVHNCDTVSMALHRFRRGGYVSTNLDEPDEVVYFKSKRRQGYY